ncbi:MAG: trypsin-like peptidase domain-containing protein [Bacteroidia bacterium]|nr:trypsin-like peptidase domain-containing protein [Bacteroidia bacterium]
MKKSLIVIIGFLSGIAGAFVFGKLQPGVGYQQLTNGETNNQIVSPVNYKGSNLASADFVKASQASIHSVVFIKTISNQQINNDPYFNFFNGADFFGRRGPVASSGSGVILTQDGYIVTNLHVIKDATQIEVITNNNKQSYKAKVIGIDPSTDLALLKIDDTGLPHILIGNSDQLQVGEWVLAVGNPFNLTSTVTAGIVSAKGRNINIVNSQFPIESFIQTDAAINPGNSGGALVDLDGKLVGINTAISSNTGSYNGYGFAIPVNIVAKIVKDLVEFNEVQRGFTGLNVKDIDAGLAQKLKINNNHGVYIDYMLPEGPAENSGLQQGDVIIKVNEKDIDSKANFDEQIAYLRPGDKVKITYLHEGKEGQSNIALINRESNTSIMMKGTISSDILGADLQPVAKIEKEKPGGKNGYRITNIRQGRIASMGIQEGFVIISVNRKEFVTVNEMIKNLETARGQTSIEGLFPNGGKAVFSFYIY